MAPTFQLSNISVSSANGSIPSLLFGLQDALNIRYDTPGKNFKSTSLFPDACGQDDNTRNCTTACSNTQQMFASLDTLHNCVVWPSIYVEDENDGLTPYATGLARSLGLEKGSKESSLPSKISTSIQNCLLASCDADDECGRKANMSFPHGGFRKAFSAHLTGNLYYGLNKSLVYFDPCHYINAPATADVAGIGVFISYGLQMGLAFIAFALAIPWKKIAHSIRDATLALWHKLRLKDEASSKSQSLTVSKSRQKEFDGRDIKHTLNFDPASAITPAVVEFQKAQCFFMLATNIASLVVQANGGLAPESLQQLYNTYIFIKVIAIGGYLPITFGLLTLRMLNKVGWYVLGLSIASVGVAIADLYNEQTFNPSQDDLTHLRNQAVQGGPTSCGGNKPITWCYSRIGVNNYGFRATNSADGADDILVVCLVTLALLLIEHFWNSPDPTNRKIRDSIFGSCLRGSKADRSSRWNIVTRWLWRYVVPALFTIFVVGYLYCFAIFADDLNWFRENKIYDSSWGFGQIVAILVWAPPLGEYLWESFRGVEDGSDHRLPQGFEVRRKTVTENGESEVDESSEDMGQKA